jgi:hypothetical protein
MDTRTHRRRFLGGSVAALAAARLTAATGSHALGASSLRAEEQGANWPAVEEALGAKGQLMDGDVFRIGMPRSDLTVTVKDVPILPTFALGSYAAFKQVGQTTADKMVMGDLVLLDAEVNPVLSGLFDAGFTITGVHNHLNEMQPHVMYVHYMGQGEASDLAQKLRQALSASATPLGQQGTGTPQAAAAATPTTELPTTQLEEILNRKGKVAKGGVVQFSVPRAETISEGNVDLLPAQGVATVLNVQPLAGGQAAITGDFVLVADEVNPVAQALRDSGIDVTALHSHHLDEEPRLFYMHFFAAGDPAELARGLRAALDRTNSAKP